SNAYTDVPWSSRSQQAAHELLTCQRHTRPRERPHELRRPSSAVAAHDQHQLTPVRFRAPRGLRPAMPAERGEHHRQIGNPQVANAQPEFVVHAELEGLVQIANLLENSLAKEDGRLRERVTAPK